MEAALIIWLASLLDPFIAISRAITVLAGVLIFATICSTKENEKLIIPKKLVVMCIVGALGWLIIPSTQTGYVMAGAYFGQSLIQSKEAEKTYNLIIKKLEKDLKEQ